LTVLVGGALCKLAMAAGLLSGGAAVVDVVLRWLSAFLQDGVLAAVVLLGARSWPRLAMAVGVVTGVVGAVDVFFALVYGGPLSWHFLAFASSARPGLIAPWPFALSLLGLAALLASSLLGSRLRPRNMWLIIAVAVAAGVAGLGVEGTAGTLPERARFGLDRHHLLPLLPLSPLSSSSSSASTSSSMGHIIPAVATVDPEPVVRSAPVVVVDGAPPRHVVLFVSESTASRFVDATTMPTLTSLAGDHAVSFDDHVAETPVSIKSLFSLMCGLPPLPASELETTSLARIDCRSLPEVLVAAGFDAGLFHGGYFAFTDKLAFFNERGFETLIDGENLPTRAEHWSNGWGVDDRAVVDEALRWLDGRLAEHRPSLAVVVPLVPHYDYFLPDDAPRPFGDKTLVDRYKNGLHFADTVLARLVDGYRARGIFDDTLFVIVGDHGEAFDEHPRNRLHGGYLYEENLRAPLVLVGSRRFPAGGQHSGRPSSHVDVAPTIIDLLGLPPVRRAGGLDVIAGQSLVSSAFVPKPTVHFTSYPDPRFAVRSANWKLIVNESPTSTELYRRGDHGERGTLDEPRVQAALLAHGQAVLATRSRLLQQAPRLGASYMQRAAQSSSLTLSSVRVFNMVRPCISFVAQPTTSTTIVVQGLSPPARTVGIGVTDASRQRRHGGIKAQIAGGDGESEPVAVVVDDVFETSSKVSTVPPSTTLTITVAPSARGAAGCLWLAP
jgi:arylsulfatase A-like enzyme